MKFKAGDSVLIHTHKFLKGENESVDLLDAVEQEKGGSIVGKPRTTVPDVYEAHVYYVRSYILEGEQVDVVYVNDGEGQYQVVGPREVPMRSYNAATGQRGFILRGSRWVPFSGNNEARMILNPDQSNARDPQTCGPNRMTEMADFKAARRAQKKRAKELYLEKLKRQGKAVPTKVKFSRKKFEQKRRG